MYGLKKDGFYEESGSIDPIVFNDLRRTKNDAYIKWVAPSMARFDWNRMYRRRGFGVVVSVTSKHIKIRLRNGKIITRKKTRDNVVIYPPGIIFKN